MASTGSQNNHLWKLADAFQELAGTVSSDNPQIVAHQLAQACRLFALSNLNFGMPFLFADIELLSTVDYVENAARENETIQALVERDIAQGSSKRTTSPSRNLIRLKRVIEMVGVIFGQILQNEGSDSLVEPITIAYDQVFAPYHGSTIKEAFTAVKEFIPTMSSILNMLNENESSVKEPIEKYVAASKIVAPYIESVLMSHQSGAALLRLT